MCWTEAWISINSVNMHFINLHSRALLFLTQQYVSYYLVKPLSFISLKLISKVKKKKKKQDVSGRFFKYNKYNITFGV